jgi:penicillin-binding protein 1A
VSRALRYLSRFARLIIFVAAGSMLVAGSLVAISVLGSGLVHHAASAQEIPLPPLSSSEQEGSTVYADNGTVLAVLRASAYRKPVVLTAVSHALVTAVLDTEDHRFYLHGGFDIPSTIRALAHDTSGSGLQGGSTITQQLVKQIYLSPERKLSRKIKEAVLADRLEQKYTKDQILQAYLNTIYLGNGAYGVEAAAETYWQEPASQLTLPQAALLAGLIQNPSGYDPIYQPVAARHRRAEVLSRMVFYHDITQAQADAANAQPLPSTLPPPPQTDTISNYYVLAVRDELLSNSSPLGNTYDERYQALFEGGLKIYTNLDPTLQSDAEQTIAADTPSNTGGFQEDLVAVDPNTGKVEALVGGLGTNSSQYDNVTQGERQPGSGFKLFTLLAALQQGYSIYDTVDGQSPCAIKFPTDDDLVQHPANNDEGNGGGVLTIQNATAQSTNCAFIRLAHEVGLDNVIAMAHRLGITEYLPPYPSIVIGSIPVHPIEMAAAYATLASGGIYHQPSFIDHIVDRSGDTIYKGVDPGQRVLSPQIVSEADAAFTSVVQSGTGTAAALYNRPVAGKTGTTSLNVDAWFNGYTPQLETTVWMGNPSAEIQMNDVGGIAVYGGTYPAHTWHDFASLALANDPAVTFPAIQYYLLPPTQYVTSASLVADDVLDHNYVAPPPPTVPTTVPGKQSTTVPANGGSSTTVPSTSPPTTTPGKHHKPPTTTPGSQG